MKLNELFNRQELEDSASAKGLVALKKRYDELTDENQHGQAALELSQVLGDSDEVALLKAINARHEKRGSISKGEQTLRDEIANAHYKTMMQGMFPIDESEKEDDEYDPRRVKARVMKHLADMYNDAKKDGGYTSEEMRFALGTLLHDMDMAGYMNSDYYEIEGFFHKGIDIKADEKINMGMLKKAYKQAKNLDTDTSIDPAVFTRGGSAMKSHATESKSELTEEQFDEAAGEKDACYHKVKSRYKVWPSAYASGALSKCRKVGAANWGNSKKK